MRKAGDAEPRSRAPSLSPFRARPPLRGVAAGLALACVALLLLNGIPVGSGQSAPKSAPAPRAPTADRIATGNFVASAPVTSASRGTLCVLGVLRSCERSTPSVAVPVAPRPAASISSWTNITPPAGKANPGPRWLASMSYDPAAHATILFGGGLPTFPIWAQDTWAFANNSWTEVVANATCTNSTCPSPREDAMMAYDAPLRGLVLFGGVRSFFGSTTALNDTWLFAAGSWTNLSATAGTAPSPRFGSAMSWDAYDGNILLFGGSLANGVPVGDTWTFNGTWQNRTASLTLAPSSRAGMAIADSPSGYLLMFGGIGWNGTATYVLEDRTGSCVLPDVAWWFYAGTWRHMNYGGVCPNLKGPSPAPARPGVLAPGYPSPCGRVGGILGWSPKNARFVLYGGYGISNNATTYTCSGTLQYLNDTFVYENPPGNGFDWLPAGDSGDPASREYASGSSDFSAGYFLLFGGGNGVQLYNSTYRYFAVVHAKLTGPTLIDTNASHLGFNVPFTVTGAGGSGDLEYTFNYARLRNSNPLTDSGASNCSNLTNVGVAAGPLPYDGTVSVPCVPTQTSYNEFRVTLFVWDALNATLSGGFPTSGDYATANWTFTVAPPEIGRVYSQYAGYFYSNFSFNNKFSAYFSVAGVAPSAVFADLGGLPVSFHQRSTGSPWFDSVPVDMGMVNPGSVLVATGQWSGWTVNASYAPQWIISPDWIQSLFQFTGAVQQIASYGTTPYNQSYAIFENYSWNPNSTTSFAIPAPLLAGNYSVVPAIAVSFSANSSGGLSLSGNLSLTPPSIDFGVVSLKLTVAVGLSGDFVVVNATQGTAHIQWVSAAATVSLAGDLGASIPLYGFNILGVKVGFTLQIDVSPTLALSLILLPTTDPGKEIINGLEVMVSQLVGALTIALSVAISFGIGIASVAIGGALSIAVAFNITPTFHVGAGWLNGSVSVQAQFLFWSVTWVLLGPATIYHWTDPLAAAGGRPATCPTCYDNGTNATWTTQSRYYAGPSYDVTVWNASVSGGPAITDVYPHTELSAVPAVGGSYVFYSDDDVAVPVSQGPEVSGVELNATTNHLATVPHPVDPGFVIDRPEAASLSDGSEYVVWAAVPTSEASLPSPTELTTIAVHGARFYPSNGTWGAVTAWTTGSIAESYRVDAASGGGGTLVVLLAPSFLVGTTTSENLLEFDLGAHREVANSSVTGISSIASLSASADDAVLESTSGNYSVVHLASGAPVAIAPSVPAGSHLIAGEFVVGAPSTVVLLFRTRTATDTVVYDLSAGRVVANWTSDQSATSTRAIAGGGTTFVFEAVHTGIAEWTLTGTAPVPRPPIPARNLESFEIAPIGTSILVAALVENASVVDPTVALDLWWVEASLPALTGPNGTPSTPTSHTPTGPNYALYLAIAAVATVALLAVVAVVSRRRSTPPPSSAPTGATSSAAESPPRSGPE